MDWTNSLKTMKLALARKSWLVVAGVTAAAVAALLAYRFYQHEATCASYEVEMKSNRTEFLLVDRQLAELLGDGVYGFMANRVRIAELQANQRRLGDRTSVLVPSYRSACGQERFDKWFDANAKELEFKQ